MNPILWRPDGHTPSQMARYMADKGFSSYTDLHRWSISKPQAFWQDLLARFELIHEGDPEPALARPGFESYGWFPGLRLNFAENLLAKGGDHDIALNFVHESGSRRQISYARLREQSARLQTFLRPLLGPQETLAAYMPNTPETVIGMLAATSLGGGVHLHLLRLWGGGRS